MEVEKRSIIGMDRLISLITQTHIMGKTSSERYIELLSNTGCLEAATELTFIYFERFPRQRKSMRCLESWQRRTCDCIVLEGFTASPRVQRRWRTLPLKPNDNPQYREIVPHIEKAKWWRENGGVAKSKILHQVVTGLVHV